MEMTCLQKQLCAIADPNYREFHSRLIPTVPKERILGVRTPILRKFAKQFGKTEEAAKFLRSLPHHFYEENNLHAFLIEDIGDFKKTLEALEIFLPFVDNWATCDMMRPKILKKHLEELYPKLQQFLASTSLYTVRFSVVELMNDYLDEYFSPEHPRRIITADNGSYYLSTVTAWYFATALAVRYEEILPYIEGRQLLPQTHKRTVQKALESFRIPKEHKEYLKSLR